MVSLTPIITAGTMEKMLLKRRVPFLIQETKNIVIHIVILKKKRQPSHAHLYSLVNDAVMIDEDDDFLIHSCLCLILTTGLTTDICLKTVCGSKITKNVVVLDIPENNIC